MKANFSFNFAISTAFTFILATQLAAAAVTPSEADIKVTLDLIRASHVLKVEILDHIILGRTSAARVKDYSSLRELGYFHK